MPTSHSQPVRSQRAVFTILQRLTGFRAKLIFAVVGLLLLTVGAVWLLGSSAPNDLQRVLQRGELLMLTRNSASTYFEDVEGPAGLDYELTLGFANYLGVELSVQILNDVNELLPALSEYQGDVVAAGITITPDRQRVYRFGPSYQRAIPTVVSKRGEPKPKSFQDLTDGVIGISAGSSYLAQLREQRDLHPELEWLELDRAGIEDLLQMVSIGELDYTIIDSTDLVLNQPFFPYAEAAFQFPQSDQLAWAFRGGNDDSLVQQARAYFYQLEQSGVLNELRAKYTTSDNNYNVVNTITFQNRIRDRLPELRALFELAANNNAMDWRLLAAVGYQESHWNPDAVSPTGVRGIMMLTQSTANDLDIADRADPAQSIDGGTRYLSAMIANLPERIQEPDRTWLALAAYNIGYGHLEDARVLTQRQGGDPDKWDDVRQRLPLLARQTHYQNLKHGYARGSMAVRYVDNIRAYYDILTWMDTRNHPLVSWSPDNHADT